ncbi:hypothetical protein CesoFtcFv8_023586 [Champsocephalus esox]|uniref:Uncharacterized protein n=1 Tax=Champsocephalus esox TaxID=159716 RepID=A0AAN8B8K4_9TELE|nr:hypothetical protein CesoFtcFv8_023586 [Champsocephalus esox]
MLAGSGPVSSPAKGHVPLLHHPCVNPPQLIYREALISFSLCQKPELESTSKRAWDVVQSEIWLLSCYRREGIQPTLGSGLPVMVFSSSWRCGQFPWEYQPGLSSDGSPSLSSTSFTGRENQTPQLEPQPAATRPHSLDSACTPSHPATAPSTTTPQHPAPPQHPAQQHTSPQNPASSRTAV